MIVCSCNVISDRDIRDAVMSAAAEFNSTAQVYDCLGCSVRCGHCSHSVNRILREQPSDGSRYRERSAAAAQA